jgi:hypothetical protein
LVEALTVGRLSAVETIVVVGRDAVLGMARGHFGGVRKGKEDNK